MSATQTVMYIAPFLGIEMNLQVIFELGLTVFAKYLNLMSFYYEIHIITLRCDCTPPVPSSCWSV